MHFVDDDVRQKPLLVASLQLGHEALALGQLLGSDVDKPRRRVLIQHSLALDEVSREFANLSVVAMQQEKHVKRTVILL